MHGKFLYEKSSFDVTFEFPKTVLCNTCSILYKIVIRACFFFWDGDGENLSQTHSSNVTQGLHIPGIAHLLKT